MAVAAEKTEWRSNATGAISTRERRDDSKTRQRNMLNRPLSGRRSLSHQPVLPGVIAIILVLSGTTRANERLKHYLSLSIEQLVEQPVSIASHSEQPLGEVPAVVSVITADDIKATGATNLVDVLQSVPGIHVRYQHFGNRPLINFRGTNNKQTLLMVNGAPMSDLMWRLGIFWKGLPVNAIERVEIIRGPGSALFGTDASAGVINVITKTAGPIDDSEIGVRIGSFDSQAGWMQYGGQHGGFDIGMTLDLSTTDGHDPLIPADAQTRHDLVYGTTASLAPGTAGYGYHSTDLRFSAARDNWRLMLDYSRHDDLETGMTGAGALDALTEGNDRRFGAALLYADDSFRADWGINAELRYRDIDYSSGYGFQEWPPGFTDTGGSYPDGVLNLYRSAERSTSGELSGVYRGLDEHEITLGAGFRWQDIYHVEHYVNSGVDGNGNPLPPGGPLIDLSGTPYAFAPDKDRTIAYLYLQDLWKISDDWELTAGARYDHDADFGGSFNPRAALVWQTTHRLTSKLLYGRAFRAPYFQELYTETSFSLPNPDLDPERSETWELSFAYLARNDLRLGMNLYHFRQSDIITLVRPAGLSKGQYQNTGVHEIRGVEFETWWQPGRDIQLTANFSLSDPDNTPYRENAIPDRQAYARIDWQFRPYWNWNLQANWLGKIYRDDSDDRVAIDDYTLVDTTVRYGGINDWEFALSVRNLLDEDARAHTRSAIPTDLPLPGRSLFAEVRLNLDGLLK